MKRIVIVLAILVIATPAFAVGVSITAEQTGQVPGVSAEVTISYEVTGGDPNLIRAFALNISANNDANITMDPNAYDPKYWVYPGSIVITAGEVDSNGSPIGDASEYPDSNTLAGNGTGGVTLEAGSLYATGDDGNKPGSSGVFCKLAVNKDCILTVQTNAPRGGIVMEKQSVTASTNLPHSLPVWVTSQTPDGNDPNCWDLNHCAGQPFGDADCSGGVNLGDLFKLKAAYPSSYGSSTYNCCADFDQSGGINLGDLFKLKASYPSGGYAPSDGTQDCPY